MRKLNDLPFVFSKGGQGWLARILKRSGATLAALLFCTCALAEDSDHADPYKAITETVQIMQPDPKSEDCNIRATADFAKFYERLGIFRDAFLNRDFSLDFYTQRRKQVLAFIVLKHAAEMITEGSYRDHNRHECHFSISISYLDKFGQDRNFEAVTWRFNDEQAAKVSWDKIDPRDFRDIALDYKVMPQVITWVSYEPSMTEGNQAPTDAATDECDMFFFSANAMFIRATTFCQKNYMDSAEGLAALAGARKCHMPESEMRAKAKSAMMILDKIAREKGRASVCNFVEALAQEVQSKMH